MLVVKLEEWPDGDETRATTLGRTFVREEEDKPGYRTDIERVEGSAPCWRLLVSALQSLFPEVRAPHVRWKKTTTALFEEVP